LSSFKQFLKAQSSYQNYKDATTGEDAQKYKDDTAKYDNITLICGITAGVSTIFYFVYKHFYNRSKKPESFYATPYIPDKYTIGLAINISFDYRLRIDETTEAGEFTRLYYRNLSDSSEILHFVL